MDSDTRSKLLEIATRLFATKGYAAVSVRELTLAAKINVSAISYYFNSKEGLYQAVLEEQFTPIWQALQQAQNNTSLSPLERLTFYADSMARIHTQRPYLSRIMNTEANTPSEYGGPIVQSHIARLYEFLHGALQAGMARGDFRADLNITYTAISLAGILNFYFLTKPLILECIPLPENANTEYIRHAFQVYLHGVMAPSPENKPNGPQIE